MSASLSSSHCHLRDRAAVEDAARVAIAGAGATRWVRFEVNDELSYDHRQERRDRPGPNPAICASSGTGSRSPGPPTPTRWPTTPPRMAVPDGGLPIPR